MKKKNGAGKFFAVLFVVLFILGSIFFGGYLILDKAVVPKYFAEYGIHNMNDLVGLMRTLYNMPSEKQILSNPYSSSDLTTATKKLQESEYPILEDGMFDFDAFNNGVRGKGGIYLTDRELAAVVNKLLDSTEFSDIMPNLNSIDTLNINICEITILPEKDGDEYSKTNANIKAIFKINTEEVRQQMANEMQIPIFLLNMIFPKELYITIDYQAQIDNSGDSSVWNINNGKILVNGSTQEQSEIFINLLISFVFNSEEQMTINKLIDNFGDILEQGTDLFGEIEFATGLGSVGQSNGIYFLEVE